MPVRMHPGFYLSRQAVREVDRRAVEELGIPGVVLMENAGRGVARRVLRLYDPRHPGPVVVLCGRGNNGGDGLVVARHLQIHRVPTLVVLLAPEDALAGDAGVNWQVVRRARVPVLVQPDPSRLRQALQGAAVVVDALLGTGARGDPRSPAAEAIEAINHSPAPVVAVDVPSGLDCDTGRQGQPCVQATWTCTFVAPKQGFCAPEAQSALGQVEVCSIGVPPWLVEEVARAHCRE